MAGDNARFDFQPVSGNDGPTQFALIQTTGTDFGAKDILYGEDDKDVLIGGTGDDTIDGGAQADLILGDQGRVEFVNGKISRVEDPGVSGDDILTGGNDPDLIIGGLGNDTIDGSGAPDILIGDAAEVFFATDGITITRINTLDRANGGIDTISGGDQAIS